MKKDVTELKKMFYDLAQNPSSFQQHSFSPEHAVNEFKSHDMQPAIMPQGQPVMLNNGNGDIHHHEEVEESLSIMDKEKELIIKA